MALTITLSNTSGASYIFSKILQFQLKKEVYTPYTTFSAQFQTDGLKKFGTICKVIVQNGSQVVHEGTVETLTVQTNASVTTISLLSYGFTKLLLHSELAPGLYPNLSINFHRKLHGNPTAIPQIMSISKSIFLSGMAL